MFRHCNIGALECSLRRCFILKHKLTERNRNNTGKYLGIFALQYVSKTHRAERNFDGARHRFYY